MTVQDAIFVAMFISMPLLAYLLHKAARVDMLSISIPSVLFAATMLFGYIGIIILYFQWDPYRVRLGIVDTAVIEKMLLYSGGVLVCLGLGCLGASRVRELRIISHWPPMSHLRAPTLVMLCLVLGLCIAVLLRYLSLTGEIPLLVAITEGAKAAAAARYKATTALNGYHWYRVVLDSLIPYCALIFLAHAVTRRRKIAWALALLVLGFAAVVSVLQVMKSKIVLLMVAAFFTWLLQRGKRLSVAAIIVVGATAFALLIPLYQSFMGLSGRDLTEVAWAISMRTLVGQISPAYFYLQRFPAFEDYLLGTSFPNPGGVLPFEPQRLAASIHGFMFQDPEFGAAFEAFGTAPTVFWGEVYANFGPFIPFLVAIFVGGALYALNGKVSQFTDTPLKSALIAWLCVHYYRLSSTGIGVYIVDIDLFAILLLTALLYSVERMTRARRIDPAARPHTGAGW
jgi:oligosaccharide repeat unit polymerase